MQRTESSRALVAALRATEDLEQELNEAKAHIDELSSVLSESADGAKFLEIQKKNDELAAKLQRTRYVFAFACKSVVFVFLMLVMKRKLVLCNV